MSLIVEVYVGNVKDRTKRKLIATSIAHNRSNLADVSDYTGFTEELGEPLLNIPRSHRDFKIEGHNRNSSVWSLVKKMITEEDK